MFNADETARFSSDLVPTDAESLTAEESRAVAALPQGSALLISKHGQFAGSRFLLDEDVNLAGRHPNADIFLDDVTVSRRHVEIVRSGNGFELRDLGSMNGTYLNSERVDQAHLNDGDEIQIGKFRLTFYQGGAN
jgi:pSer/pThr/pTyr-binding forkhead associated (FHA) protein